MVRPPRLVPQGRGAPWLSRLLGVLMLWTLSQLQACHSTRPRIWNPRCALSGPLFWGL